MSNGMNDIIDHHLWATRELLDFLATQPDTVLDLTTPGVYGTIGQTLTHLIGADSGYLKRLAPQQSVERYSEDDVVSLATLSSRATTLAPLWQAALAAGLDVESTTTVRGDTPDERWEVKNGVFLVQAIHHANEHRGHIASILGANGIEPPDLDGWLWAMRRDRGWVND